MRFRGGGVGHKSTQEATDFFKKDRDQMDIATVDGNVVAEEAGDDDEPENIVLGEEAIDDEEEDYGYAHEYSSEGESEGPAGSDTESVHDFGAEDDGGAVDPFMDELGYADL